MTFEPPKISSQENQRKTQGSSLAAIVGCAAGIAIGVLVVYATTLIIKEFSGDHSKYDYAARAQKSFILAAVITCYLIVVVAALVIVVGREKNASPDGAMFIFFLGGVSGALLVAGIWFGIAPLIT